MGWKFWKDKTSSATETATYQDAELAGFETVRTLVEGRPPFDRKTWLVGEIPAGFVDAAERCVWAYHLNVYLDLIGAKFGKSAEELVRACVTKLIGGTVEDFQDVEELFGAVSAGRALYRLGMPSLSQVAADVAPEHAIAVSFMRAVGIAEEDQTPIFLPFASCLSVARVAAQRYFAPEIERKALIPDAEMSISWSPRPGCFERHLQRRYQNPIFPAARRFVTRHDLTTARLTDLRDFADFYRKYRSLVNELMHLGTFTLERGRDLWKRIFDLKERAAAVGGGYAAEVTVLDTAAEALGAEITRAVKEPGFEDALLDSASMSAITQHPILAQYAREDSPIRKDDGDDEWIRTVLSEDESTIHDMGMFLAIFRSLDYRVKATAIIEDAIKDGLNRAEGKRRLHALLSGFDEGVAKARVGQH